MRLRIKAQNGVLGFAPPHSITPLLRVRPRKSHCILTAIRGVLGLPRPLKFYNTGDHTKSADYAAIRCQQSNLGVLGFSPALTHRTKFLPGYNQSCGSASPPPILLGCRLASHWWVGKHR